MGSSVLQASTSSRTVFDDHRNIDNCINIEIVVNIPAGNAKLEDEVNATLWVIQVVLALAFAAAGTVKLVRPRLALAGPMPWVVNVSDVQLKGIGTLEVMAAIGLLVPAVAPVASFLVPLAAVGVVFLMLGAIATNMRIKERQIIPVNLLLLVLAAFVAWERFGPYHF